MITDAKRPPSSHLQALQEIQALRSQLSEAQTQVKVMGEAAEAQAEIAAAQASLAKGQAASALQAAHGANAAEVSHLNGRLREAAAGMERCIAALRPIFDALHDLKVQRRLAAWREANREPEWDPANAHLPRQSSDAESEAGRSSNGTANGAGSEAGGDDGAAAAADGAGAATGADGGASRGSHPALRDMGPGPDARWTALVGSLPVASASVGRDPVRLLGRLAEALLTEVQEVGREEAEEREQQVRGRAGGVCCASDCVTVRRTCCLQCMFCLTFAAAMLLLQGSPVGNGGEGSRAAMPFPDLGSWLAGDRRCIHPAAGRVADAAAGGAQSDGQAGAGGSCLRGRHCLPAVQLPDAPTCCLLALRPRLLRRLPGGGRWLLPEVYRAWRGCSRGGKGARGCSAAGGTAGEAGWPAGVPRRRIGGAEGVG